MRYMRCKCGKSEYWDGGVTPQPCQGCEKCQTTYAGHPEDHAPLEPHVWEPRYNSRTGIADRRTCTRCHQTEKVDAP